MRPTALRRANIAVCSVRPSVRLIGSLHEIGAALQEPNRERDNQQHGHADKIENDRRWLLLVRPHRGPPRGHAALPAPIDPAFPETSCANPPVRASKPDTRLSATSCFRRYLAHLCWLGGADWPRKHMHARWSSERTMAYRAPERCAASQIKFALPVLLERQRHQADDRVGPGDAALLRPTIAVEPDILIGPGLGQQDALCPQPIRLRGGRATCREDGILHRMPFSPTTWKIGEMCAPATFSSRHQNGEIVLHGPAPSTEHKTPSRQLP